MKKILSLLLVFCAIIFSPSANSQQKKAGTRIKITQKDNGKTITLKVKKTFDITFTKECVGCAQVWATTAIDTTKIAFLSNTCSNKSCTNCTGGSQDHTFHFKVKKAGNSTLSFSYFEDKFSVTIVGKK